MLIHLGEFVKDSQNSISERKMSPCTILKCTVETYVSVDITLRSVAFSGWGYRSAFD